MIFSFFWFTLFLLLVSGIYYIVPVKLKRGWLLLVSYLFCLSYGVRAFYVLACSTLVSYLFGIIIDKVKRSYPESKKVLICLWGGIAFCVIPLLLVKINQYSLFAGIGISFYLLQEIGYLADIYYGKRYVEKNIVYYALFIAFFPKLVSGPIERSGNLLKQIDEMQKTTFNYDGVKSGLLLMLWGYFQKSIIADSLAVYVATVYDHWEAYAGGTLCLASIVFAFQLYADFAGYTNIAIGAAQALGFHLEKNFEQPYLADSIKEFWRRWHISLSSWLKDYIYIPLGGSRKGTIRYYVNLMITFMVSGLWHGYGLNFVAWGTLHGAFQIMESICSKFPKRVVNKSMWKEIMKRIYVFILVDIAWICFRASGLKTAIGILHNICFDFSISRMSGDLFASLSLNTGKVFGGILSIVFLLGVDLVHEKGGSVRAMVGRMPAVIRWTCYMGIVLILSLVGMTRWGMEASNFFYMQF